MRRSNEWYKIHLENEIFYGIKTNTNVNVQDMHGQSALYRAAYRGHSDVVQKLLEHPDIDPNVKTQDGVTAIYAAAAKGNTDCVRYLLEHPNINPNIQKTDGASAIYTASFNGREELLELLLNHPWTNPNLRKNNGGTALYCAAEKGYTKCMELLLENMRLDPNVTMQPGNDTPLTIASSKGHRNIVLQIIDNPRIDVNHQNENGDNALIMAADKGDMSIIKALLEHPAIDVNARNESGMTALMFACWKGVAAMADMLLKAGADWQLNNDSASEEMVWNKHHAIQALIKTKVKSPEWLEMAARKRLSIKWYTASIYSNTQELQNIFNQDDFLSVSSEILDRAHKAAAWSGDSDTEQLCRAACARKEKEPQGKSCRPVIKNKSAPSPQKSPLRVVEPVPEMESCRPVIKNKAAPSPQKSPLRVVEPVPEMDSRVSPKPNYDTFPIVNRQTTTNNSHLIHMSISVEEQPGQLEDEQSNEEESPGEERKSSAKKLSLMMMNVNTPKTKTGTTHNHEVKVVPNFKTLPEPKVTPMDMSSLENSIAEIVLKRQKEKEAQNAETNDKVLQRNTKRALMGFMSSMYSQDQNNNS